MTPSLPDPRRILVIHVTRIGDTVMATPALRALAQAIGRLLDDPELARRLGSAARAEAVKRFSQDRMLDQMEAVFLDALAA